LDKVLVSPTPLDPTTPSLDVMLVAP